MKTKFVPAIKGLDQVTTQLLPAEVIGTATNQVAGFDNSGALEAVPGWNIDTTSGGLNQLETYQPNNLTQNTNLNSFEFNSDPLQNSPNETMTAQFIGMSLDVNNNGFSQGTGGTAAGLLSLNLNHQGSSNIGSSYAISATPNFGNGTDPFTMQGWAYAFGFGTFNANVTIDGAIQGYGFQPNVNAAAASTANFNCNAFYDFATIGVPVHSYNAFSSSPNIASIANNSSYTGLTINPTIPLFSGNAGFTGVALAGTLGTIGTNGYQGVSINPTISAAGANNAVGLNISMLNVTGTNIQAINTSDGQVSFTNNNLKNGQPGLTANSTVDTSTSGAFGGVFGNNQIGGQLVVASGHPINGDFGFGNNLGVMVIAQDDMAPDGSGLGLGFSMNGFVSAYGAAAGKTFDTLNFMAAGASNAGTGADTGTFTNVNMFRALGLVPGGGAATVVNQIGFKVDSFFSSASPTNAWGFYNADTTADNWFAKNLIIGGVTKKPIATEALGVTGLARVDNSAVDAAAVAILAQATTNTTADHSDNTIALQTSATATVAAGATNDKAASGSVNTIIRGDGTDDGTLEAINGNTSLLFHNSGAAGVTNKAFGYSSVLITQQGTITDSYDFYAERAPAGGTVTNHYGVYVKSDSATPVKHWLGDKALVGGTSFSTPTVELDVQGDARIRNFAANGVVTNDASGNLLTVAPGTLGNVLQSDGTAWISAPGGGSPTTNLTDWVAYTPTITGFGATSNVYFFSRRVGDHLEVQGSFQTGTPTSVQAKVTVGYNGINNNVTIDSTKLTQQPTTNQIVGYGTLDAPTANTFPILASAGDVTGLFIGTTSPIKGGLIAQPDDVISAAGNVFSFFARVAIVGWTATSVFTNTSSAPVPTGVKTANYTILPTDGIVLVDSSGGTFTVTFPTVPVAGQIVQLKKVDSSLIPVAMSGPATGSLNTLGEYRSYVYDGASWTLTSWNCNTEYNAYTPTFQGFGVESNVLVHWSRNGKMMRVTGRADTGTVGGSSIQISLPANVSISTLITSTTTVGVLIRDSAAASFNSAPILANASNTFVNVGGYISGGSSGGQSQTTGQVGTAIFNNNETESFYFDVPISGWEP